MMFYNSLVSLVVALAAAGSVAASAIPEARGNPKSRGGNTCSSGSPYCCNSVVSSSNPVLIAGIGDLAAILDPSLLDGLDCTSILSGGTCNSQQLCCQQDYQGFGINCVQVNVL